MFTDEQYLTYRSALRGRRLPLAFIDLQAFDANVETVRRIVAPTGKTIRLGTKSIRCEPLLRRIFQRGGEHFRGLLTFTVEESGWLAGKGYDDMIVAYPTFQPSDLALLAEMRRAGKQVMLMADHIEHLRALSAIGRQAAVEMLACLEVDMSYRPAGLRGVHLGLRRSPLRTPQQALALVEQAQGLPNLRINSLMGYEGHIAGVQDNLPGKPLNNFFMRLLKTRSVREFTPRRDAVIQALRAHGLQLEIVNGGGSGSLVSTLKDPLVNEVTVGSGFFCSALFHHFHEVQYQPAAFFALQVVRIPAPGMLTCLGGGYPASGSAGPEKLPRPVLPVGLQYLPLEGAGEVQTPLILPPGCPQLALGDPVIFQHAKAGELCERFDQLWLLHSGESASLVDSVPTYRGEGKTFL
jgi:D-serine deaminase-like pyridoxal phosphate-dependent protein